MASKTTGKTPAKTTRKPQAGNIADPTGSLASAAQSASRKRGVKAAQQAQRSSASEAGAMSMADIETRKRMVAEAAYYRAQMRNFEPGHDIDDWLDAEAEIDGNQSVH